MSNQYQEISGSVLFPENMIKINGQCDCCGYPAELADPAPCLTERQLAYIKNDYKHPSDIVNSLSIWRNLYRTSDFEVNHRVSDFGLPFLKHPVHPDSLMPENYTPASYDIQHKMLSAWMHITDRCNLRCSYCYLPHQPADMSEETGLAAVNAAFRSALINDYQHVILKYAGGEPLLRFSLIKKLHGYAQTLADQHGLFLTGVILSNGTLLTPEIVKTIQTAGLRLMISLDGLDEFYNRQRCYSDGSGSAADVIQSMEQCLTLGLIPDISVIVSGSNVEGLPELICWILEHDLPFSLNLYRENDQSMSYTDLKLEEHQIISGILAAYKVIENNLPRSSLLLSLADRANLAMPHLHTCSVGQGYLVFDPRGRVAKCQMQIDKPVTTCKASDPLAAIRDDKAGIQNLSVEEKQECGCCEWKYWCAGGCPLVTYRTRGRYDVKSPNCSIYKAIYPEVVRLEVMRLLRYTDG